MLDDDPCRVFGSRLNEIRRGRGWSQERLASESGLARSYIGGVERGQRNIALRNICKLADALRLSPAVLLAPPDSGSGARFKARPQARGKRSKAGTESGLSDLPLASGAAQGTRAS
jgi:transcriptional regulator with XRE-family HTH domain